MPSLKHFVGGAIYQLRKRLLLNVSLRKGLKKKKSLLNEDKFSVPTELWGKILDYCSPYDVLCWRRVSKRMKAIVDEKLKKVLYLQVFRMNLSLVLEKSETDDGNFYRHTKAQILLEISSCNATLIVHDRWTAHDIARLFAAVRQLGANAQTVTIRFIVAFFGNSKKNLRFSSRIFRSKVFGKSRNSILSFFCVLPFLPHPNSRKPERRGIGLLETVKDRTKISASIAELLTVGQSTLGLERWYSFQCYLKALNNFADESAAHVQGVQTKTDVVLFPKLKELTVRVAVNEVNALVRLKDYGTNLDALYFRDSLQMFRLCLIGQQSQEIDEELLQMKRRARKQLKSFKQWLNCASLGERYCQQYI